MTTTTKNSNLIPELFTEAIAKGFSGLNAFEGTGCAIVDTSLTSRIIGEKISVPYFNAIGEFAQLNDGAAITPTEFTSSKEQSTVKRYGLAFDMTRWAKLAEVGKPYEVATNMVIKAAQRKIDSLLVEAAIADLPAGMKKDISAEAGSASKLSYGAFIDALSKFGDEQSEKITVIMHSAKWAELVSLMGSNGHPIFADAIKGGGKSIFGCPVFLSDKLAADGSGNYTTLLVKPNALVAWVNKDVRPQVKYDGLTDSETVSMNMYAVAHRYSCLPGRSKGGVAAIISK